MDIPDDIDGGESMKMATFEFDDGELDDMNHEELSTWLDKELDEDEVKFFESVESEEEAEALQYNESADGSNSSPLTQFNNPSTSQVTHYSSERPTSKPINTPSTGTPVMYMKPLVTNVNNKSDCSPQPYSEALNNLAFSMRRTELSRAELLRQRNTMPRYPQMTPQVAPMSAHPSAMSSLAGLLTGKKTSLTVGLEQSRRQLREYMVRMNNHAL